MLTGSNLTRSEELTLNEITNSSEVDERKKEEKEFCKTVPKKLPRHKFKAHLGKKAQQNDNISL